MNLFEFFTPEHQGFYSGEDDNSIIKKSDTRKTRLTLGQLNKLRIMNDIRKLEYEKSVDDAVKQYGAAAQPQGGGLGLM